MTSIDTIVLQLSELLINRKYKVCTAESCTGGWVAKSLTDLAGSSQWFDRGWVTYSNEAKNQLLGVKLESLAFCGAVSEQVVKEMVWGALSHSEATLALAVTGIAGPSGGTTEKPVGTVWIAWANKSQHVVTSQYQFTGDREHIRMQTVIEALKGLIRFLQ